MKRTLKGIAVSTVVLGVLLVVAVVAIIWLLGHGGFGLGGGKGDGKGRETEAAPAVVTVTTAPAESETTTVSTEMIEYINVTVFGGDYLYQGDVMTLDEVISSLKGNSGGTVMVIDKGASKNAYDSLISALGENGIAYMEEISD